MDAQQCPITNLSISLLFQIAGIGAAVLAIFFDIFKTESENPGDPIKRSWLRGITTNVLGRAQYLILSLLISMCLMFIFAITKGKGVFCVYIAESLILVSFFSLTMIWVFFVLRKLLKELIEYWAGKRASQKKK